MVVNPPSFSWPWSLQPILKADLPVMEGQGHQELMLSSNGLVNQVGTRRDFHLPFNEEGVIHLVIVVQGVPTSFR